VDARGHGSCLAAGLTPADAADAARARATFFTADAATPELAKDYLSAHPGNGIEILTFTEAGKDRQRSSMRSRRGALARWCVRFTSTQIFPIAPTMDDFVNTIPLNVREHAEPLTRWRQSREFLPRPSDDGYAALESGSPMPNSWR